MDERVLWLDNYTLFGSNTCTACSEACPLSRRQQYTPHISCKCTKQFQADPRMTHSYYLNSALEGVLKLNPDHILLIWSEPEAIEAGREYMIQAML